MSVLLALALAQGVPLAEAAAPSPDIVVMARKLKNWRGEWKLRKGRVTCKTRKSTGDKEIDAIGCQAMSTCLTPHVSGIEAITSSKEASDSKNKRLAAVLNSTLPCVNAEHEKGLVALAERRAG